MEIIMDNQRRIQDFQDGGGANFQGGGINLLFNQIFPQNCMKMEEFGPREGARIRSTPLRSATDNILKIWPTSQ